MISKLMFFFWGVANGLWVAWAIANGTTEFAVKCRKWFTS